MGMPSAALARLIEDQGTVTAFARRLRISRQSIYNWQRKGIPAERVQWLVTRLKGSVTKHDLRPDLWGVGEQ